MKSATPKVLHKVAGPGSIFWAGMGEEDLVWKSPQKMRPDNKKQARHE